MKLLKICFILIFVLLCMFLFIINVFAQTEIQENTFYNDVTWKKEGSPYIIKGNVKFDRRLNIDAGVTVLFDGNYYIEVSQHLNINGTTNNIVLFDTTAGIKSKGVNVLNGGNIIKNCIFRNSETYNLKLTGGNNYLLNCSFDNSSTTSLYLDSNSNTSIINCNVSNCETGIDIYNCTNTRILNTIINNSYCGVNIYRGDNVNIKNCNIYNNIIGISLFDATKHNVNHNNIFNNTLYNVETKTDIYTVKPTINFISNYWGTSNMSDILLKFKDKTTDLYLPEIDYSNYHMASLIQNISAIDDIIITPIEFLDINNKLTKSLSNLSYIDFYIADNSQQGITEGKIIISLCNGSVVKDIKIIDCFLSNQQVIRQYISFSYLFSNIESNDYIKIFLWNGIDTMRPISKKTEFGK